MNETTEDLLNLAQKFLNIHPNLDPRVFDKNGKIHELLRLRILHRANYMAQETIEKINGLHVDDVILLGSSASYFYRQESDLDAIIKISNKSCPYLPVFTKKEDGFTKYIAWLNAYFYSDHQKFYIGKRYLDIKLATYEYTKWTGAYSLQKNDWIEMPPKNVTQGITPEKILEHYYTRCQEIDDFMKKLPENGEKYSQEECDKMFQFYAEEVIDKNQKIEDYLAFKIIKSTGKLKELSSFVFRKQLQILEF